MNYLESRKEHQFSSRPQRRPKSWELNVVSLLSNLYKDEIKKHNAQFFAYGLQYSDECLLAITLTLKDHRYDRLTFKLSIDSKKKFGQGALFDSLVDIMSGLLELFFSSPTSFELTPKWQNETISGRNIFYSTTREDMNLTLLANQLLEQS